MLMHLSRQSTFAWLQCSRSIQPRRFVLRVTCPDKTTTCSQTGFSRGTVQNRLSFSLLMHLVWFNKHHSEYKNLNGCQKTGKYCLTSFLLSDKQVSESESCEQGHFCFSVSTTNSIFGALVTCKNLVRFSFKILVLM